MGIRFNQMGAFLAHSAPKTRKIFVFLTSYSFLQNSDNCTESPLESQLPWERQRGYPTWLGKKGLEIQCHFHTGQSRWVVCRLQRNLWEFPKVSPLHSYHPLERVKYDWMGKMPKVSDKKRRLWGRQIKWCWGEAGWMKRTRTQEQTRITHICDYQTNHTCRLLPKFHTLTSREHFQNVSLT